MGPNIEKSNKTLKNSDFRLNEHSFDESKSTAFNYELWKMAHSEVEQKSSTKYFATSMMLHVAIVVAAAVTAIPMIENRKTEIVEFEIMDPGVSTSPTAPLSAVPATPEVAPESSAPTKDDVIAAAPKKPAPKAKAAAPKPIPVVQKPSRTEFKPAKVQTFKTESPVIVRDNLDDIQDTDLDEAALKAAPVKAQLDEQELNQDFNKVDATHRQKVAAIGKDLDQQSDAALSENEQIADQMNAAAEAEAEKMAAFNAARRARDAQAIAAAEAGERAAAARAAAEERAAQERAAKAQAGAGGGDGNGMPAGIRLAENLRQKPGNPVPQYEQSERLQRQAGNVVFIAYVNDAGVPSQFRMMRSTGYRNLDAKTLKALKQWRFYPGQEGWVAFPFNWDLKGGAKEMPALLRRR